MAKLHKRMKSGTPTKLRVLLTGIYEYNKREGCAPAMREMSVMMGGISTNTVSHYLIAMEHLGWIVRGKNKEARKLNITPLGLYEIKVIDAPEDKKCPHCGHSLTQDFMLANTTLLPVSLSR